MLLEEIALDLVEVVAVCGNVALDAAVVAFQMQWAYVVWVLDQMGTYLLKFVDCIRTFLLHDFKELKLVQIHYFAESAAADGDTSRQPREEADLAKDVICHERVDESLGLLLNDDC